MSTPPIRIPITADDQYSAVLSTAQAKVREFGASSGVAGEKMRASFHEAKGAAALLGEETGIHLNRHLRSVLASSQLLGPALAASFNVAAAIGFAEVIGKIPDILKGWFDNLSGIAALDKEIEEHSKLAETYRAIAEHVAKVNEEIGKVGKSQVQITLAAQAEAQFRLINMQLLIQQQEMLAKVARESAKRQPGSIVGGGLPGAPSVQSGPGSQQADLDMAKSLGDQASINRQKIVDLAAEFQLASAEFSKAVADAAEKTGKSLEAAAKKFDEFRFRIRQERTKSEPSRSAVSGNRIDTFTDMLAMQAEPNQEIAAKYLKHFQDLQAVFAETRRPAELLAISIQNLNDLFRGDTTSETYKRALENIKDRYDEARQAAERFGQEVGHALEQGALMGRNWKNVLDSLIIAFTQLILKMYLLKALQDSSFGSSKIGGFFTSLVSGFGGGKAGGGPVSGGMPYLVGEQGPEIFMPNTSGSIVPNGKWGRGGDTYIIDARGADMGVEQKIIAAMEFTRKQAVAQAVGIVRENSLRGRG